MQGGVDVLLRSWYTYNIRPTRSQIQRCEIGHAGLRCSKCLFQIGQIVVYRLNIAQDKTNAINQHCHVAGIKNKIKVTLLCVLPCCTS